MQAMSVFGLPALRDYRWGTVFSERLWLPPIFAQTRRGHFKLKFRCHSVQRRNIEKYPLKTNGDVIPYVKKHVFLEATMGRGSTWTPYIIRIKRKHISFISLIRFLSGISWGATVSSLLQLYQALFLGFFTYSAPAFTGSYKTHMDTLTRLQARALRASLGFPRSVLPSQSRMNYPCLFFKRGNHFEFI